MIVFSLLSLLAGLLSLSIGNYVLCRGPKNDLTLGFYILTVGMFLWGCIEFCFHQTESYDTARRWQVLMSFWPMGIAVGLHFVLVFTEKLNSFYRRVIYFVMYLPAVVFSAWFFIMIPKTAGPVMAPWGWALVLPQNNSICLIPYIWVIMVSLFSIITCFRYYLDAVNPQIRQHAGCFFWCVVLALVPGIMTIIILPWVGGRVPPFTSVGIIAACVISGIAVWRNNLFILTPTAASGDIISTMKDALFLVNAENNISFANTAALNILGYSNAEIINQPINIVLRKSQVLVKKVIKEGAVSDTKTVLVTKDREEVAVSVTASVIKGRPNVTYGIVFIIRDITEGIQSIARLKESEDKFRGIAERSFDLVFMVGNDGRLTYVSPALEPLFQYCPEDVLGQPFTSYLVSDDVRKVLDIYDQFNEGKDIGTQQVVLLKKDGSHAFAEFNLSRIYKDDKQVGAQGIVRDITDRKKDEEALKESEKKYRMIFENVNDAIVFMDPFGKILDVNLRTRDIFGLDREQIVGRNYQEFSRMLSPEDFEKIRLVFEKVIAGEPGPIEMISIESPEGSKRIVEGAARLILKDGDIIGLLVIVCDVTKRINAEKENKTLEAHLFRGQKMEALGTMASGVAHDFNNSLGSIILNAEVALEEAPAKGELRQSLEQVLKTGKHAKKLVHQILTFSRDQEAVRRPMNIAIIVKETMDMLNAMLPSSIHIKRNIETHTAPVLADATQIQQLVMNLCSNSAHAMKDKGGDLVVGLENICFDTPCPDIVPGSSIGPGRYVKLMVKDTGHGIAPEIRDRVFDPFFTTKHQGEGTGLGLSVVHGIVAGHEGGISVDTEPGKGTNFTIYFPTVENEVVKAIGKNGPMPSGCESILFVDDEPDFVDISKRMLSRLGYRVDGMTSAVDALEMFESQPERFDILITDLTMPVMTGIELSKAFMRIRPDIPVIVCTGLTSSIRPEEWKRAGIKDCIVKPFVVREMAEKVRRVLDEVSN